MKTIIAALALIMLAAGRHSPRPLDGVSTRDAILHGDAPHTSEVITVRLTVTPSNSGQLLKPFLSYEGHWP
jgi:hypothetical protein